MVFCQTKRDADELAVSECIKQEAHVLHGDIPQDKREMVLKVCNILFSRTLFYMCSHRGMIYMCVKMCI